MKKSLLVMSLLGLSSISLAENYQAELGASYTTSGDIDGFAVRGLYHFDTVDTSNKPLAEAGFLDRSSNISLTHLDIEDFDATTIAAELYLNKLYIAPSYTDPSFGDGQFAVALGYVGNDWLLTTTVPEEDYEFNVSFKKVTRLSTGNFINVAAEFADGGDFADDTISLATDYYLDTTLSVGGVIINTDETDFGLRVNKFFTGKANVGAEYIFRDDDNLFSLQANIRF